MLSKSQQTYVREYLKKNVEAIGIGNCISDLALTFNTSECQMLLYIEELFNDSYNNGSMEFKGNRDISSKYVEQRWKGER